jgi:hypothetical protein
MPRQIISRHDAEKQGLKRYFTGQPCNAGHIADRYVNNHTCVDCMKARMDPANIVARAAKPRATKIGQYLGWNPVDVERDAVRQMTANGITVALIAKCIGVPERDVYKHCKHDLETGAAEANNAVANSLFYMATEGPIQQRLPAAIFWLKVRAGWREVQYVEMLRPPSEMTDDELEAAIALAQQGTSRKAARRARGSVVEFAAFRAGKTTKA